MSKPQMRLGALAPGILFLWKDSLHVKTAYSTKRESDDAFLHICVSLGTGEYAHLADSESVIPFDLENERLAELGRDDSTTPTERWARMRDIAFERHMIEKTERGSAMNWGQPYRSEEFWFMKLERTDRYGLIAWLADGTSKGYNPSIHYEDDYAGDWDIRPRFSHQALSDAQDWVERLIDLSPQDARADRDAAG